MRLFVAIDLPEERRRQVASLVAEVRALAPDARWQRSEALHLTLAFLGHLPEEQVPAIREALARVAADHGPLQLAIGGAGSFGTRARPRILFLELQGELEPLAALQGEVAAALEPLGYEPEHRQWRPHLTLARARQMRGDSALAAAREAIGAGPGGAFEVRELLLYQSELSPQGSRYTPLARLELGTGHDAAHDS